MNLETLQHHLETAVPIARDIIEQTGKQLVIVTYDNFQGMNVGVLTDDQAIAGDHGYHELEAVEIARVLAVAQEAGYRIVKEEDIPF